MMAVNLRKPSAGLIHHSDHSSQYASLRYQASLKQHGIMCSMSRKGNCWDNAVVERFFSSLKREWIRDNLYRYLDDAIRDVRAYIVTWYNSRDRTRHWITKAWLNLKSVLNFFVRLLLTTIKLGDLIRASELFNIEMRRDGKAMYIQGIRKKS